MTVVWDAGRPTVTRSRVTDGESPGAGAFAIVLRCRTPPHFMVAFHDVPGPGLEPEPGAAADPWPLLDCASMTAIDNSERSDWFAFRRCEDCGQDITPTTVTGSYECSLCSVTYVSRLQPTYILTLSYISNLAVFDYSTILNYA